MTTKHFVLLFFAMMLCAFVHATTWYVDGSAGNNTYDGKSWGQAQKTLKIVLQNAIANDVVWIKAGTYKHDNVRDSSFHVKAGVHVFGGFDGTEATLEERKRSDLSGNGIIEPWEFTHQTILDGDIGAVGDTTDNSYHVLTMVPGTNRTSTIDGLVIQNGYANDANHANGSRSYGAGVFCLNGDKDTTGFAINMQNCVVRNNYSIGNGAGLDIESETIMDLTISGCLFFSNIIRDAEGSQTSGGGLYARNCRLDVTKSMFANNVAPFSPAIDVLVANEFKCLPCVINRCIIVNNSSTESMGATLRVMEGDLAIVNSTIANNKATGNASSCLLLSSQQCEDKGLIYNTAIWGNKVVKGEKGYSSLAGNWHLFQCAHQNDNQYIKYTDGFTLSTLNNDSNGPRFFRPTDFVGSSTDATTLASILASNWNITATSPLVNAGTASFPETLQQPETDLAGTPRVMGNGIDIGALEYPKMDAPGNALSFNGNNYVGCEGTPSFGSGNAFTVEAWVKASGKGCVVSCSTDGDKPFIVWVNNEFHVEFISLKGTNNQTHVSSRGIKKDSWQHVAITYSGNETDKLTMYINGELDSVQGLASDVTLGETNTMYIGGNNVNNGIDNFTGLIDELRVWNTARTRQDIMQYLHQEPDTTNASLVAYYNFDQLLGTSLPNIVAPQKNSTLINGPGWVKSQALLTPFIRQVKDVNSDGFTIEIDTVPGTLTKLRYSERVQYGEDPYVREKRGIEAPTTNIQDALVGTQLVVLANCYRNATDTNAISELATDTVTIYRHDPVLYMPLDGHTDNYAPQIPTTDNTVGASYTQGVLGGAMDAGGTQREAYLAKTLVIPAIDTALSVSLWFRLDSLAGLPWSVGQSPAKHTLFAAGGQAGSSLVAQLSNESGSELKLIINEKTYPLCDTSVKHTWSNLALVYEGDSVTVYFNGDSVYSAAITTAISPAMPLSSFVFGAEINQTAINPLWGALDEVRVFNRAITPAEVNSLRCKAFAPQILSVEVESYSTNTATLKANILADSAATLTFTAKNTKGIDKVVEEKVTSGDKSVVINGLDEFTLYQWWVTAENKYGKDSSLVDSLWTRSSHTYNDSMVIYLPFNKPDAHTDHSGQKNHLVSKPIALFPSITSDDNYILQFDKGESYRVRHSPSIDTLKEMTLAFWIRPENLVDTYSQIFYKKDGFGIMLSKESDGYKMVCTIGGTPFTITNSALNFGEWVHFTMRYGKDRKLSCFVNGLNVHSDLLAGSTIGNSAYDLIVMGGKQSQADTTNNMSCKLDDIRLYNRAISDTEAASLAGLYPSLSRNEGLLAYYPIINDSRDHSGNNFYATYKNTLLKPDRFNIDKHSVLFDGSSAMLAAGIQGLDITTFDRGMSISTWVNFNDHDSTQGLLWGNIAAEDDMFKLFKNTDDKLELYVLNDTLVFDTIPAIKEWHLLSITVSESTVTLYVDGKLFEVKTAKSNFINYGATTLYMGMCTKTSTDTNSYYLNGYLDDIRLYQRTISAAEVDSLYHLGGWPCSTPQAITMAHDTSLVSTYQLPSAQAGSTARWAITEGGQGTFADGSFTPENKCATYTLQRTDSNACGTIAGTLQLSFNADRPSKTNTDTSICPGTWVKLTATEGSFYQWIGHIDSTKQSIMVKPGNYSTYRVKVTNAARCHDTSSFTVNVKAQGDTPTLSKDNDNPVCLGTNITITATAQTMDSVYFWKNKVQEDTLDVVNPVFTYQTAIGTDSIYATAYYLGCPLNSDTIVVETKALPEVNINTTDNTKAICLGDSLVLSVSPVLSSYQWNNDGALTNDTLIFKPVAATNSTLLVKATDANGCSDTASIKVTVNDTAILTIKSLPSLICSNATGSLVEIAVSIDGGSGDFGGTGITKENDTTAKIDATSFTYNNNNDSTIASFTYTYTTTAKCTSSIAFETVVYNTPEPNIISVRELTVTPTDNLAKFDVEEPSYKNIVWYYNKDSHAGYSDTIGTGSPFLPTNFVYDSANSMYVDSTYEYRYTQTINGCESEKAAATYEFIDCDAKAPVEITNNAVCYAEGINATFTVTLQTTGNVIRWFTNENKTGNIISDTNTCQITITKAADTSLFAFEYNKTQQCYGPATKLTQKVNPVPVLKTIGDTICKGEMATVSVAGANSYAWSAHAGTHDTLIVTPGTTTSYTATGTDTNGCTSTESVTVVVNQPVYDTITKTIYKGDTLLLADTSLATAGTYTHRDTTIHGCDSIVTIVLTVVDSTVVDSCKGLKATFTVSGDVGCSPLSVTLTDNTKNEANRSWYINNNKSSDTNTSVTPSFTNTGTKDSTYTVSLVAAWANGCRDTLSDTIRVYPAVKAAFSIADGCSPLVISSITNTSSNATTYSWNFGGGATSTEESPSRTFVNNGLTDTSYTVKLTASTSTGCSDTISKMVTVYAKPAITLGVPNDTVCFNAGNQTITVSGSENTSFSFDPAQATEDSTYQLSYSFSDSHQCKDTATASITVNYVETPVISLNQTYKVIGKGGRPTVSANISANWYHSDSLYAFDTNKVTAPQDPTSDSTLVFYAVLSQDGCTSDSAMATVYYTTCGATPPSVRDTSVCENGSIPTFSFPAHGDTLYYKVFNGDSFIADSIDSFTPSAMASDTFTIYTFDTKNMCQSAPATFTLIVNQKPATPDVSSQYSCYGDAIKALSVTNGGSDTVTWFKDDILLAKTQAFIPTVSAVGTSNYKVVMTDANGCTSDTTGVSYTIRPLPVVTIVASDSVICSGDSVSLYAPENVNNTYTWNNSYIEGEDAKPSQTTTYIVTATNTNGCKDTASQTITVHPLPTLVISATNETITAGASTIIAVTGANSYDWSSGIASNDTITVSPKTTTTYSVTGTNSYACVNKTSITITVVPVVIEEPADLQQISARVSELTGYMQLLDENNLVGSSPGQYPQDVFDFVTNAIGGISGNIANDTTLTKTQVDSLLVEVEILKKRLEDSRLGYVTATGIALSRHSLSLSTSSEAMMVGVSVQPPTATVKSVRWRSNDVSVVRVSDDGLLSPVGVGKAVVVVSSLADSLLQDSCWVTVLTPVEEIVVPQQLCLQAGTNTVISPGVYPPSASSQGLQWYSMDTSVATVDPQGRVVARRTGTTNVVVLSPDGSAVSVIVVSVIKDPIPADSVTIASPTVRSTTPGSPIILSSLVYPPRATVGVPTWLSSDPSVATIDPSGTLYPLKPGTVTIYTLTHDTIRDSVVVTVLPSAVPRVTNQNNTFPAGTDSVRYSLKELVRDDNTPTDSLRVKIIGGQSAVEVTVKDGVLLLVPTDSTWHGTTQVQLEVTDLDGLTDTVNVTLTLSKAPNQAPVISPVGEQTVKAGSMFAPIELAGMVTDDYTPSSQIKWSFGTGTYLAPLWQQGVLKVLQLDPAYIGSDSIVATAIDEAGAASSRILRFTISDRGNEAPVLASLPDQVSSDTSNFLAIKLTDYVSDDYTAASIISWTTSSSSRVKVSIVKHYATFRLIDPNWIGTEAIVFTATDGDGLSSTDTIMVTNSKTLNASWSGKPFVNFTALFTTASPMMNVSLSSSINGASSWRWTLPGATNESPVELSPVVTYKMPGVYPVTLEAMNEEGTSVYTREMYITVAGITRKNYVLCKGVSDTLTLNVDGMDSYQWSNGSKGLTSVISPDSTSTYWVVMKRGLFTFVDSIRVQVSVPADLGGTRHLCQGQKAIIAPTNDAFVSYAWNNFGSANNKEYTTDKTGMVTLKAVDTNNCVSDDTVMVHVHPLPVLDLGSNRRFCSYDSVTLDAGAGTGYQYLWHTSQTSRTIVMRHTSMARVTVTDTNGCRSTDSVHVTRLETHAEQIALVTYSESDDKKVVIAWQRTAGKRTKKYIVFRESKKANIFSQYVGENTFNNMPYVVDSVASLNKRSYRYSLATIDSTCNDTAWSIPHKTIHLQTFDTKDSSAGLSWNAYEGLDISSYIVFRITNGGVSTPIDTLPASSNTGYTYNDYSPLRYSSNYRVCYVLPRQIRLDTLLKSDGGPYSYSISNMAESQLTADKEAPASAISIRPMPATDKITIEGLEQPATISIVNILGVTIHKLHSRVKSQTLDINSLPEGIYVVQIETELGIETKPLVISRN